MNVSSSVGFTPTLPVAHTTANITAAAGEQDPGMQSSSVKQAQESARQDLQKEQEHNKHDSTAKQQQLNDQKIVSELAARDREVRAHEQAHASVGGAFAGSPKYTLEQGPNGVSYAVGGEVSVSTAAISGDPHATIRKADTVRRAALAPAAPSSQDRAVATQATKMKIQAQVELAKQAQDASADKAQKPGEVQQDSESESAGAKAADDNDHSNRQNFLERNLMTEQALTKGKEFARSIDELL